MTFKIVDGREYFYQWDTNRQIAIDDPTISEVHFCNRLDNCSLVVEVVDGIANVPNILLQKSFDIRVFAYDGEATLFDRVFEVKARTQPSDYVYTETDIRRYEDLAQRIDEIERNGISEEVITEAVENYLDEHPINLEGYATEDYVNEAVSNVSVDLSGYAKESYVDEAITQSVSGLAKKTDIPDVSKFITNIPSEYITESELNSKGYLTQHQSLDHKADKNHTHSYNDLTNKPTIPSIEGLASEQWVKDNTVSKDTGRGLSNSISNLAAHKADIEYVNEAISNIDIPEVDLSNVYTKATNINITNEPAGTENIVLTTDKTGIPNVSEAALVMVKDNNGGFDNVLTRGAAFGKEAIYTKGAGSEVQTLSYPRNVSGTIATEEYVNEAIANIEIPDDTEVIELNLGAEDDNVFVSKEIASRINVNPEKCIIKVSNNAIRDTYYRFNNQAPNEESLLNDIQYSAVTLSSAGTDIIPTILHIRILYVTDINTVSHAIASLRKTILKNGQTIDTDNYYTKSETYSKTEVDEAIAGAGGSGGGGGSYTFTNGLTETDGTVTNDFYKAIRITSGDNIVMGHNENSEAIDKTIATDAASGCLVVGEIYRSSWTQYPSISASGAKGSIIFGNATAVSGSTSAQGIKAPSSTGVIAGGYTSGGHESGLINVYSRGCVGVGIGDNTTGRFVISHFATSALGRSLQSTAADQFLIGRCNDKTSMTNMAFIIGNGTNDTTRSNALTVDKSGNLVAAGTVTPTGADYAEYFEFEDGNPNKEDRIGYLVELINGKIRFANGTDIIGATSGSKGVIGDAEEMNWHGKYERDEFGRYIYEDVPVVNGKDTEDEYTEIIHTKKISANYDPNRAYTPRSKRPEWYPVGLLGKVLIRHDGTLSAGDYVKAINGIASKSEEKTNIRVLEVVSENVIRVLIK